ncbi:MAG: ATP-binding protein [Oscillospiraceae bacterium]
MPERTFPAEDSALRDVLAFTEEQLEAAGCPMKKVMQITVAIEEMFVNIAHYAYPAGNGAVRYSVERDGNCVIFRLTDSGVPFDPLAKPDPDITLSAKERKIGGLGIYMMKQTMDELSYEYTNGENILTMKKII